MQEKTEKEMLQSITAELLRTRTKLDRITKNVVFLFWFVALPFILSLIFGIVFFIAEQNKIENYNSTYLNNASDLTNESQKILDDLNLE